MDNYLMKFIGLGYLNKCQACVSIYDIYGNLVLKKMTYNGEISVCLKSNNLYYLCAKSLNNNIRTTFYTEKRKYKFYFPRSIYIEEVYTFLLTDSFYKGLNIEKGEIFLCQK